MEKQQITSTQLDKFYNQVLAGLREGKRPSLKLDHGQLTEVQESLSRMIHQGETNFEKPLAILCHIHQGKPELIPLLHKAYACATPEQRVFVLRAFEKHSLETMFIKGKKVGHETLEVLSHALKSKNLELENYALYLLEQIGMQIVVFKNELGAIANRSTWFNSQKKVNKESALKLLKRIPSF